MNRQELPNKLTGTSIIVTFNFTNQMAVGETIDNSPLVHVGVHTGTDPDSEDMVSVSATASGAILTQVLTTHGVIGVIYELVASCTSSLGQRLKLVGLLAVVPENP